MNDAWGYNAEEEEEHEHPPPDLEENDGNDVSEGFLHTLGVPLEVFVEQVVAQADGGPPAADADVGGGPPTPPPPAQPVVDGQGLRTGAPDGCPPPLFPEAVSAPPGDGHSRSTDRHSAKFYLERLQEPLFPGARLTLIQMCYALAKAKYDHHLSDTYMDNMLSFLSKRAFPTNNLLPPSLYLLNKCIALPDPTAYEQHVCVNDCCKFPKLSKQQYHQHAADTCPVCDEPRFRREQTWQGEVLKPRKVFWDFGLGNIIRDLYFTSPEFCERRGKARKQFILDFYMSPEAHRLDRATGGAVFHPDNSVYQLGFDFVEVFVFRNWSMGVIVLRCAPA